MKKIKFAVVFGATLGFLSKPGVTSYLEEEACEPSCWQQVRSGASEVGSVLKKVFDEPGVFIGAGIGGVVSGLSAYATLSWCGAPEDEARHMGGTVGLIGALGGGIGAELYLKEKQD